MQVIWKNWTATGPKIIKDQIEINNDHIILSNPPQLPCVFSQYFHRQEKCIKLKLCGFAQKLFMFAYPCHPCVVYLPTFTKESNHMHVNIPCMDGMGYACSCFFFTSISFSFFTSPLPIFFWPKRFAYSQFSILNQKKHPI